MFQDFELLSTMKSLICCVAQFQVAGYTPLEDLRKCTSERDSIIVDNFYTRNIVKMTIASFCRWKHSGAYAVFKQFAQDKQVIVQL